MLKTKNEYLMLKETATRLFKVKKGHTPKKQLDKVARRKVHLITTQAALIS